jgi:hypothetical protein
MADAVIGSDPMRHERRDRCLDRSAAAGAPQKLEARAAEGDGTDEAGRALDPRDHWAADRSAIDRFAKLLREPRS